ncbi:MAG: methionine synthase [Anaerolineae bacterium]|nr:methionine synthase [Anaerolineae bacterium]
MPTLPALNAFSIGSLPFADPERACRQVAASFPAILGWPQLPRRSFRESMYAQYSERFPGVVLGEERMWVDRDRDLDPELEALYRATLDDDLTHGAISPPYAAGLHAFLAHATAWARAPRCVKGQVTGPISWGLTVVDQDRRPILYDEILADATAQHLRLKARWQEQALRQVAASLGCSCTLMAVDEPYMSSFGSAYVALDRTQAAALIQHVLDGIEGLSMVHCCGNTDWSLLLETSVDVLSFDAYGYAPQVALYPDQIARFVRRGGMLAWGITPKSDAAWTETTASLVDRLRDGMGVLAAKAGLALDDLLQASLISPSCGLGPLSDDLAEHVLSLTVSVAEAMRERYA